MRRIFAFLMCVSGFSLAVTYTHADEPAATPIAEPANPAARPEPETAQSKPSEPVSDAADPAADTLQALQEMKDRWRALYRQDISDDELRAEMQASMKQVERLYEESRRLAENYAGPTLERVRAALDKKIARLEESLEEAEEQSGRRADHNNERPQEQLEATEARPEHALAPRPFDSRQPIHNQVDTLRELAERLKQVTGDDAQIARAAIEQQIDQLERSLVERRERRDAVVQPPMAGMIDTERRLVALKSAIINLKRARFDEQAAALEPELKKLEAQAQRHREQLKAAREAADVDLRKSQPRLHIEQRREAGAFAEVRELSEEVRQLRRELRRLGAEVQELRQQHAPSADREGSEEKSPDRESE